MNLFPPILESQAVSMKENSTTNPLKDLKVYFTMPLGTEITQIQHVQVLIRRQANMEPWVSGRDITILYKIPDIEVIYLPREAINGINNPQQSLYSVNVPAGALKSFLAGDSGGQTYTLQIRFGASTINGFWDPANPATSGFGTAKEFTPWKNYQITNSLFGEWSNTQRMFVHSGYSFNVKINPTPVASLSWDYLSQNDPLIQVRIKYSWSTPDDDAYGNMFRAYNLDFESKDAFSANAAGEVDFGVMRFGKEKDKSLQVVLTLTTINNTVIQIPVVTSDEGKDLDVSPTGEFKIPVFNFNPLSPIGTIRPVKVEGDEIDDGVLAVELKWGNNPGTKDNYHNIYRINLRTLEAVLLLQIPPFTSEYTITTFETVMKDYSIEMGEEYIYFGAGFSLAHVYQYALEWNSCLDPGKWNPYSFPGYARQMDFQGNAFLTTRWGQLRLQGNTQVSNFKRETSDQFTTTIGGVYPFYSRSAQFNYRTFSLQSLVTMNFDPTNTFLRFRSQLTEEMAVGASSAKNRYTARIKAIPEEAPDKNTRIDMALTQYYREMESIYRGINPLTGNKYTYPDKPLWMTGQLWSRKDQDNEALVLRDTELFSNFQFSNSGVRFMEQTIAFNERLGRTDDYNEGNTQGPRSIFNAQTRADSTPTDKTKLLRDATPVYKSDRASDLIYAERKFRDTVMSWLSDGKPKLFRSETEGNIIVMLTGVSFTPLDKSRLVYSLSCTATEIAEYNLSNLILYGLVPVKFESYFVPVGEYDPVLGIEDKTPYQPYSSTKSYIYSDIVFVGNQRYQVINRDSNPPIGTPVTNVLYWTPIK